MNKSDKRLEVLQYSNYFKKYYLYITKEWKYNNDNVLYDLKIIT